MNSKYAIGIVAAAVIGILASAAVLPQAFSAILKLSPEPDVTITEDNMPPLAKFSISIDNGDLSLKKGDKDKVVKVKVESQDDKPLNVSLEFHKPDAGLTATGQSGLEGKIKHKFSIDKIELGPKGQAGSSATIDLTLSAGAAADSGSTKAEVYAYVLDGTIPGDKDPSKGINVYTGHGLPLNLTVTE